jgi:hypothetical protein
MAVQVKLDPARVAKLMEGMGQCIAIYQRIETLLKLLLPHIADPALDTDVQPMPHWRSLLDSKQTLGPLVKQFSERMNSDNPQGFSDYLEKLVDQRNELIHHFFNTPIGQARTDTEIEHAIVHLGSLRNFAKPFLRALEDATKQFVAALETSILAEESRTPPES